MNRHVSAGAVTFGNDLPFVLIGGPCQIETKSHAVELAGKIVEITEKLGIPYVFKASFDKANRTSITGARGIGLEKAMEVFSEIRERYGCPVVTDVHEPYQCAEVAPVVGLRQLPAFGRRRGRNGKSRECQKGPVLGSLGYEKCCFKG